MAKSKKNTKKSAKKITKNRSIKDTPKNITQWLTSRPAAYKKWRQEDKKKRKYRSFRLQKKIKPEPRDIPTALSLIRATMQFIFSNWRKFAALVAIYGALYVLLVRSPISTDMGEIQDLLGAVFGENSQNSIERNLATLGAVLGSGQNSQSGAAAAVGVLSFSLIVVWLTRQLHNKQDVKVRDAIYQGLGPIIPVFLLLVVFMLQIAPFSIAAFLYTTARSGEFFVSGVEDLGFFLVTAATGVLSFYWATSTVIALYAVSLQGMYPMKALRAAKKLVKFQRFLVFRRIVALPIILGLIYTLILLIVIRIYPNGALVASEIMQVLMIPIVNVYLYKLYRKLI